LDALTLALGGRGDVSLVRAGSGSGQVVAVFQLPVEHPARQALRDSSAINDQPVSAGLLQALGRQLVEIHGQHDERALIDPATHRAALDAFGGHLAEVAAVATTHAALSAADAAVAMQRAGVAEAAAREEYARHVVDELSALRPEAGEEETLADRRSHLMQLERA